MSEWTIVEKHARTTCRVVAAVECVWCQLLHPPLDPAASPSHNNNNYNNNNNNDSSSSNKTHQIFDMLQLCCTASLASLSSICLSVPHRCIVTKHSVIEKSFYRTRIISSLWRRLSAYKIWRMQCKGSIYKFGAEWKRTRKMCIFNRKNGHISKTVKDEAKVTINHQ